MDKKALDNQEVEHGAGPLVSVVMPAYNASRFITEAVNSVLAQSYQNWELLIVNDASPDNTLEIARNLADQDSRIHVIDQPQNGGVAKARNTALEIAKGKYIAFLDSDDIWSADKLDLQVSLMESEGVTVCYGAYTRIDEDGNKLGDVKPPESVDYQSLLKSNFIGNLTGIYNAETLGKELLTDFRHEDYVAWLSLLKRAGKAKAAKGVLGQYRVYSNSLSSNKVKTLSWQWKMPISI